MDHMEAFFNHLSDWFWSWRPFRRLRPQAQDEIGAGKFLRLLPLVAALALALIVAMFVLGALADIGSLGTLMARGGWLTFRNNLRVIFTVIGFRTVFLTIFVSYGLTLLSLPYPFFWNRRARRLRREPVQADVPADVWPPPPNVPGRTPPGLQ